METWITADREALRGHFGSPLNESNLAPLTDLEDKPRGDVQDALEHATAPCGRNRAYRKGDRSFDLLAELDPAILQQHLPHFRRFVETLKRRC